MGRDFGITNSIYCNALSEIKTIKIPNEHFEEVFELFDKLSVKFEKERKDQIVSLEESHKPFDL